MTFPLCEDQACWIGRISIIRRLHSYYVSARLDKAQDIELRSGVIITRGATALTIHISRHVIVGCCEGRLKSDAGAFGNTHISGSGLRAPGASRALRTSTASLS